MDKLKKRLVVVGLLLVALLCPAALTAPAGAQAVFSGTTYTVGPTITPTTTQPEAEEHIAVDPGNFSNLLAATQDIIFGRAAVFTNVKYAFSSDGGVTWDESFTPTDPATGLVLTGDGHSWTFNGDPVVGMDRLGNAYLALLYASFDANGVSDGSGIYVAADTIKHLEKIRSGGAFPASQIYRVFSLFNPGVSEDKPWVGVDNSSSAYAGNVYVTWTHFDHDQTAIFLSRSTDQGRTWSLPVRVRADTQQAPVQWSQVAVGPSGEVYVVYLRYEDAINARLYLAKSVDGGGTFSPALPITPPFKVLNFASTYRKSSLPALAVSPTNGNVYVAYPDQPDNTVGAEVEFIRSTDGGASFSAPLTINDVSTGHQFMPAITVDGAGILHAMWFDTRNSPDGSSAYFDIYATFSTDGGATFRPSARVTPSTIYAGSTMFIGDYAGIAAGGGYAHPVWSNASGSFLPHSGSLQTATLTLP